MSVPTKYRSCARCWLLKRQQERHNTCPYGQPDKEANKTVKPTNKYIIINFGKYCKEKSRVLRERLKEE